MITPQMRYRMDILMGDDGTQYSLAAVELLHDLAYSRSAYPRNTITLLEVVEPDASYDAAVRQAAMEQAIELLKDRPVKVISQLVSGWPADKLVEYSEHHPTDLIVLGAKGRRATLGIDLGGVAQQVVEYSRPSVLVVRVPYTGLKKVLAVVDGSDSSREAIRFLARFPLPGKVEVQVMTVLPPIPVSVPLNWGWPFGPETMMEVNGGTQTAVVEQVDDEADGQEILDEAIHILKENRIQAKGILLCGDAATEIIAYARASHINLIVTGARGLSPSRRWLLGSVARKLVHYSGCSVLVVKDRAKD